MIYDQPIVLSAGRRIGVVRFQETVEVDRPAEAVFALYSDVERWPQWTASMTEVRRLDDGPLRVGAKAHVRQPRLRPADWTVTELEPGRSFVWETRSPGLRTRGGHHVRPRDGGCTVVAEVEHSGLLAPLVGVLTRGLTHRYLQLETSGLKRLSEET
jgi:uncharacterized membrane protein